jgi:hypothetical protein
MSFSLYDASIPVVYQQLSGLSGVIDKAAAYVAEKKVDPQALLGARFAPDMYPLAKQIQIASMWGVTIAARLSGVEPLKFSDDEKTFEDLKARVAKAIEFAKSVDRQKIEACADTVISIQAGANLRKYKGKDFLMHFALPHFFFHCTTAYDLVRHCGLPLAKRDYMGPVQGLIEG